MFGISAVMWIRIRSDPHSIAAFRMRITIQGYKIKGKAEFNQQIFEFFLLEIIFFKSETKKVAYY